MADELDRWLDSVEAAPDDLDAWLDAPSDTSLNDPSAPAEPDAQGSTPYGVAVQLAQVPRGVGNLPAGLMDLLAQGTLAVGNYLTGQQKQAPMSYSQAWRDLYNEAVGVPEPRGTLERVAARSADVAGEGLVPAAAVGRYGWNVAKQGMLESPGSLRSIAQMIGHTDPRKLYAAEVAAGATAGALGYGTEQAGIGRTTGEIAGSAPIALPVAGVRGANALRRMTWENLIRPRLPVAWSGPPRTARGIADFLEPYLRPGGSPDDFQDQFDAVMELRKEFPGLDPTSGRVMQASGEDSLRGMEIELAKRDPDVALREQERVARSRDAVNERWRQFGDDLSERPTAQGLVHKRLLEVRDAYRNMIEASLARAQNEVMEAWRANPDMDPAEAGELFRGRVMEARARIQAEYGPAFEALDPRGTQIIDIEGLYDATRARVRGRLKSERAEKVPFAIEQFLKRAGRRTVDQAGNETFVPEESIKELLGFRKRALADLRDLHAKAPADQDKNAIRLLQGFVDDLDPTLMDPSRIIKAPPWTAHRYRALATSYRETMGYFSQQALDAVLTPGRVGAGYQVGPEDIVAKIFHGGRRGVSDMKAFNDLVDDAQVRVEDPAGGPPLVEYSRVTPEEASDMRRAVRQFATRSFLADARSSAAAAENVGGMSSAKMDTWLKRHSGALSQDPELRRGLQTIRDAQKALESGTQTAANQRKVIDQTVLGIATRKAPERLVDEIMSGPTPEQSMSETIQFLAGDETALRGLRRAFFEWLEPRVHSTPEMLPQGGEASYVSPSKLAAMRQQYDPVIRQLWGHEGSTFLQDLERASRLIEGPSPGRVPAEYSELLHQPRVEVSTMNWLTAVFSLGPFRRRALGKVVTAPIINRWRGTSETAARGLIREAMFDPQIARDLVLFSRVPPEAKLPTKLDKRIRGYLAAVPTRQAVEQSEREVDSPLPPSVVVR